MALEQNDLEQIERVIYKNGDDIAISLSRSFERLEERIDAVESRLFSRLSELEDFVEGARQSIVDTIAEMKATLPSEID